jgi:glycosyltransferase involved in cell wall biosynthesis
LTAQGIDETRIHIIPHPPMRLSEADPNVMASVADPHLPRILFFGTLRPYKGFDSLVEACLQLWGAGLQFELAVAGKAFFDIGPLLTRIESAGYAGRLVLDLGFLKETRLDAHLRKADILAFPYRHIDSSGAFLSALHYGKATVASNTGMFAEFPRNAAGELPVALAEAGNASALAEALLPLIESPAKRQAAGERARILGTRLGDWKDMAVQTVKVYDAAIAARAAR